MIRHELWRGAESRLPLPHASARASETTSDLLRADSRAGEQDHPGSLNDRERGVRTTHQPLQLADYGPRNSKPPGYRPSRHTDRIGDDPRLFTETRIGLRAGGTRSRRTWARR